MPTRDFSKIRSELQLLRPLLLTSEGRGFLALFDEFLREHEFGLALHALCDYMLEPSSPRVSESTIRAIQDLHFLMEIDDSCVADMRNKQQ